MAVFSILCLMDVYLLFCSCKSGNTNRLLSKNTNIDILINTNISCRKAEECCNDDIFFKIVKETTDSIYIDASSVYYDEYTSGRRFTIPMDGLTYCSFLNLQFDIINNSTKDLDIEELAVHVNRSHPDSLPFLFMHTTYGVSNVIIFQNESWFNWSGFNFRYSILKKGEKNNGKYQYERHINYFDHDTTINLLPELIEQGYNFRKVCETVYDSFSEIDYNRICRPDYDYEKYTNIDEDHLDYYEPSCYEQICLNSLDTKIDEFCLDTKITDSLLSLFYPFDVTLDTIVSDDGSISGSYSAHAFLVGEIEFDKVKYLVKFSADVILGTTCGLGAVTYENDRFDIELRENDTNYTLRFPYSTVIHPNGNEMVALTIKAPKSSKHSLFVSLKNGNGLSIRSKDISIHYLQPRHYIIYN